MTAVIRPVRVLLIEDNPGDVRLVRVGLNAWRRAAELRVLSDGEDAFRYLEGVRKDPAALPDLVILDLGLPRRNGLEILQEIKSDTILSGIPVVVFTSSHIDVEKLRAQGRSPDLYLVKPIGLDEYLAAIGSIESFWSGRNGHDHSGGG